MPAEPRDLELRGVAVSRLGVVVHPSRDVGVPLAAVLRWADAHRVEVGQVVVRPHEPRVAEPTTPDACDLLVAIGGDGTVLGALHAAAAEDRPVVGVACGSLGALALVRPHGVDEALDAFAHREWVPIELPALQIAADGVSAGAAINDVVVLRDGPGQVAVTLWLDGALYLRFAGDGVIVSTPAGSSAYTLAAGGPLMAPGSSGLVATPLAAHAGSCPPLVAGPDSRLRLQAVAGYGGARVEIDGQRVELESLELEITHRPDYVTLMGLLGQESALAGLRRRGIIADGPRLVARDARDARRAQEFGR